MLQARSFRGEVILTHETRADSAAQWLWRLRRVGATHTIVLMRGEHSCAQLRKMHGEEVGCVWFAHSVSYSRVAAAGGPPLLAAGEVALFLEEPAFGRLQLAAMVLRLGGYNVLSLDTDVVVQDDVYWWMQQPEYRGYALLAQRDVTGLPNLGVMYLRGGGGGGGEWAGGGEGAAAASPSGPTAWALSEAVLRNVRWLEQPQLPAALNCTFVTCYDQAVVVDSIYSALVGRPIFWRCLEARQLDRTWNTREDGRKRFLEANERLIAAGLSRKNYSMSRPGPACHAPLVGPEGLWGVEGRLALPHFGGLWPEELGGRALGDSRGPAAEAFVAMMREAGTSLWPDSEDPATATAAAAVPPERFALLSRHLACDWASCGSQGMFLALPQRGTYRGGAQHQQAEQEPCVVLGHLQATSSEGALAKRLQLMTSGHYNMELSASAHGPGGPFFATNPQHQGLGHHASLTRAAMGAHHVRRGQAIPAPKVIALAPGALSPGPGPGPASASSSSPADPDPVVLHSKAHLVAVVEALASLAVAAGRTLALPRLSCDFPWMHQGGSSSPFNGSHHVPWSYLDSRAFAPYGPSLEHLSCEWLAWAQHGCLHGPVHVERPGHRHVNPHPTARMLLSYELEYLIRQLPQWERSPRAPAGGGADGGGGGNLLTAPPGTAAGPDGVTNVTLAQVSELLSGISAEAAVLWVDRPMRVTDLSGALRTAHQLWVTHCCGLSWPNSRNHICLGDF